MIARYHEWDHRTFRYSSKSFHKFAKLLLGRFHREIRVLWYIMYSDVLSAALVRKVSLPRYTKWVSRYCISGESSCERFHRCTCMFICMYRDMHIWCVKPGLQLLWFFVSFVVRIIWHTEQMKKSMILIVLTRSFSFIFFNLVTNTLP